MKASYELIGLREHISDIRYALPWNKNESVTLTIDKVGSNFVVVVYSGYLANTDYYTQYVYDSEIDAFNNLFEIIKVEIERRKVQHEKFLALQDELKKTLSETNKKNK
jgi:hypothetical protein